MSPGALLALTGASLFALSLITARYSYDYGSEPQTVMFVRFLILASMMVLWRMRSGALTSIPRRDAVICSLLGVSYFIGIGSYLLSVAFLPVSLAVIIFYTFPILVALGAALNARRWPGLREISALLLAFSGLFIVLDVKLDDVQPVGILFAVTAALGVCVNMLGGGYILRRVPTTVFSFYQSTSVLILSAIALLFSGGLALPEAGPGMLAFGVMLIAFIIAFFSVYNAIRLTGPVRTATIMNLEPVMTVGFAIWLLGEQPGFDHLIGGLVVLAGVLLAQSKTK